MIAFDEEVIMENDCRNGSQIPKLAFSKINYVN